MSGFGWQEITVLLTVLAAAGWLVRRQVVKRRQKSCGCDDCPGKQAALEAARHRRPAARR